MTISDPLPRPMTKLRRSRAEMRWSQRQLISRMRPVAIALDVSLPGDDSLITSISRWENGRVERMTADYRQIFRTVYGRTDDELGLVPVEAVVAMPPPDGPPADVIDYYEALFAEHVRADNLMGPRFVRGIVQVQAEALSSMLRTVRGPARPELVAMTCRYQEFLGWLSQDAGDCDRAMAHTDRARDLAGELRDADLSAYLLMRKSNIATDAGDPVLALRLIEAADRPGRLPASLRPVILRQKANAHAALGQPQECERAIGQAFDLLVDDTARAASLAPYCTAGYLAMEAGTCWVQLGRPEKALATFRQARASWTPDLHRDHSLSLARLGTANAAAGNVEDACKAGLIAVELTGPTGSARTLRELQRLRDSLRPWSRREAVRVVSSGIASLVGAAA